jgi:hypothetical protein
MKKHGIGMFELPTLLGEGTVVEKKSKKEAASSTPPPLPPMMERHLAHKVEVNGKEVFASNARYRYQAEIGGVYSPKKPKSEGGPLDDSPKVLLGVGLVGEEWQASIGPVPGARGRTRGMLLASFLTRYVTGERVERKARKGKERERDDEGATRTPASLRLVRIEAKLDLLLQQLGVKL